MSGAPERPQDVADAALVADLAKDGEALLEERPSEAQVVGRRDLLRICVDVVGEGQVVEGVRDLGPVADLAPDRERTLIRRERPGEVALPVGDPAEGLERFGRSRPGRPWPTGGGRDRRVAGGPPRSGRASARSARASRRSPGRSPGPARRPPRPAPTGSCRAPARAARASAAGRDPDSCGAAASASSRNAWACRRRISSTSPRASSCSRANAWIVSGIVNRISPSDLGPADQALVGEVADAVEDVPPPSSSAGPHTCSAVSRSQPPDEAGQPVEQVAARLVEEVVAPGDRPAQRALALGDVAGARREQLELALEPGSGSHRAAGAGRAPRRARSRGACRRDGRRSGRPSGAFVRSRLKLGRAAIARSTNRRTAS